MDIIMKTGTRNSAYTKEYNRKLILSRIHKSPVSRAELARITGLTRAAITIITDELISDGVVREKGTAESEMGRKPILLEINPDSYYAIGLNVSRDKSNLGVVDLMGNLKTKKEIKLTGVRSIEEAIKIIVEDIKKLLNESGIPSEKLLGLGLAMPGPVDVSRGVVLNPPNFKMWENVNIVEKLKNELPYNMLLENNSAALALSEKNFGLGKKFSNFILIVVDSGIGSGIIINNKLYRGFLGLGGEIGHTTILADGELCSCGNVGCLELYTSMPAVLGKAKKIYPSIASWNDIIDRAESGDGQCLKIIDEEARYLSAGIINAVNILEIEAVVLTGEINYKSRLILNSIYKYVNQRVITRNIHKVELYASEIEKDAEVVAAATVMIEDFFWV